MSKSSFPIDSNTFCIDGYDLGMPERTGSYILDERPLGGVTIIETGPSASVIHIKNELKERNIPLEDIKYIIVTHIHLDHAGGAGLLLNDCPNANVLVHTKGKRHLHNPSRLIMGAKAIYGDSFEQLFDPIIPIHNERLLEMTHESTLILSPKRSLTFYDTPGHANHHLSIYDSRTATFFTGDTIGIRYPELARRNIPFFLPSTSPNQFDPNAMLSSLKLIESKAPERIAFGHFGVSETPNEIYKQMRHWIPVFVDHGKDIHSNKGDWQHLKNDLLNEVKNHLLLHSVSKDDDIYDVIQLDLTISSMGLIDFLKKG